MSNIADDQLFRHADRVRDKVVVITGAANGIGKDVAYRFASYGAKVVIGDLDAPRAEHVVQEIEKTGGKAISRKCNVTAWDDQVALFETAIATYGSVDIVVANAGIGATESFVVKFEDGKPQKPNMSVIDINLYGTIYTAHLSQHYLRINRRAGELKALVLVGSMASWTGFAQGELYSASKHGVLGLMRSLYATFAADGMRIACIHPFFADTQMLTPAIKSLIDGIDLAPIPRIAGAMFCAATDPNFETNGDVWLIPDGGEVFTIPKEQLKYGVYEIINKRARAHLRSRL